MKRWIAAVVFALAIHLGAATYFTAALRQKADAGSEGAIDVELMPDASEPSDTPSDVSGPKMAEAAPGTAERPDASDPEPPAPDAAAPTKKESKPDASPALTAPPAPSPAQALLQPEVDKPPVEKPPEETKDKVERETAPSRASSGSTAQLEGGRRPSAAAKATWAGAIGTHLSHLRRYPKEARDEGWQGVARVRVTIDGDGHVMAREIIKSSGRTILDEEALALMNRSDPFPKPPQGMATPVALTVPVKFAIR